MSKNALTVENLNKIYLNSKTKKENKALTNLTFEVKQGEVFGLLGPNGAGKTTFLSILGGTVIKTSGHVNVWGFDLDKNQLFKNYIKCWFLPLVFFFSLFVNIFLLYF